MSMRKQSKPKPEGYGFFSIRRSKSSDETAAEAESRRRISLACTRCRNRKIRCDGARTCSKCIAAGKECDYIAVTKEENMAARERKAIAKLNRLTGMTPVDTKLEVDEISNLLKRKLSSPNAEKPARTKPCLSIETRQPSSQPMSLDIQSDMSNGSLYSLAPRTTQFDNASGDLTTFFASAPATPASETPLPYYGSTSSVTISDYASSSYSSSFSRPVTPPSMVYTDSCTPITPAPPSTPTFYPSYDYSPVVSPVNQQASYLQTQMYSPAPCPTNEPNYPYPVMHTQPAPMTSQPSGLCMYIAGDSQYNQYHHQLPQAQPQPQLQSQAPTYAIHPQHYTSYSTYQPPPPPPQHQFSEAVGPRPYLSPLRYPTHMRSRSESAIHHTIQTVRMDDVCNPQLQPPPSGIFRYVDTMPQY